LESLAGKNLVLLQSAQWVHSTQSDLGKEGTIPTSYIDEWAFYGSSSVKCPDKMVAVKDRPGGDVLYQLQVFLGDGTYGDLVQLRKGEGQVEKPSSGSLACSLDAAQTQAGILASKLAGQADSKSAWQLKEAKAWFDILDGRQLFVVAGVFHSPGSAPPIQTETYTFDLENGLLLNENVRMQWQDGSLMGETLKGYRNELLSELPEEVARQFEQARAELKSYQEGAAAPKSPVTATPAAQVPATIPQDLPYTQENLLTGGEQILSILSGLRQAHITWLSRPGWYLFGPRQLHPNDWMLDRYVLTHVTDSLGSCELMTYYIRESRLLPQEIRLADGAWGLVSVVDQGPFTEGTSSGEPCRVEDQESVLMLDNEIDSFRDLLAGKIGGEYRAWIEETGGKKTFILFYDIQYASPKPTTMDPETHKLEVNDRSLEWNYFDLETGSWLAGYELVYLENGKVLGAAPPEDGEILQYDSLYYESPPAEIFQAFEQMVAKLKAYLENNGQ
jgi:hypothetical protein